jgi:hypothetical protein
VTLRSTNLGDSARLRQQLQRERALAVACRSTAGHLHECHERGVRRRLALSRVVQHEQRRDSFLVAKQRRVLCAHQSAQR